MTKNLQEKTPVLLLKTKSTPVDTYEEHFSSFANFQFHPTFVPVLEHRFKSHSLHQVELDIKTGSFTSEEGKQFPKYGAIIFTSQRAVEAFSQIVDGIRSTQSGNSLDVLLPKSLPLYVVGPATARGLRALGLQCPILGEETGNGDALSDFILEHYNDLYKDCQNPRILFLVGDKRRDIIPKKLQSAELPLEKRSIIDELVIYETGEMMSFKDDFTKKWQESAAMRQWIVVFSPTGCKAMLESLDLLDSNTGRLRINAPPRNVFVATIGPTTRDYLVNEFGFVPDVCADTPTPEGIAQGISSFVTTTPV